MNQNNQPAAINHHTSKSTITHRPSTIHLWHFPPAWFLVAVLFAFTALGCFPRSADDRRYFIVDATREVKPTAVRPGATLRLRRFEVDAAFASRQLVYRIDEFRYESDYFSQFLVAPGVMIMTETRDWLEDSGLFVRVSATAGRLVAAYTLDANVKALYADFRNREAPVAVVEIRFLLVDGTGAQEEVLLSETYHATAPIAARTAEAVVAGLSRSLETILSRLEADLRKKFEV